ncbi:hypothetical protein ACQP1G_16555 [Nocardia sp. CA-107356]|uniref:hypothetical protein n=1 Tax=Nocardia sp. CA-107356 TaxID=3239972 RepID=UPI003D8A8EC4
MMLVEPGQRFGGLGILLRRPAAAGEDIGADTASRCRDAMVATDSENVTGAAEFEYSAQFWVSAADLVIGNPARPNTGVERIDAVLVGSSDIIPTSTLPAVRRVSTRPNRAPITVNSSNSCRGSMATLSNAATANLVVSQTNTT